MKISKEAGESRLSLEHALEEACLQSLLIHEIRGAQGWVKSRGLESPILRLKAESWQGSCLTLCRFPYYQNLISGNNTCFLGSLGGQNERVYAKSTGSLWHMGSAQVLRVWELPQRGTRVQWLLGRGLALQRGHLRDLAGSRSVPLSWGSVGAVTVSYLLKGGINLNK